MIEFRRYPHVGELISHYANSLGDTEVVVILESGVKTEKEAYKLSRFVVHVVDQMAKDTIEGVLVLGSVDNTNMIPDIDYEISLYLANKGMEGVWDAVCNES